MADLLVKDIDDRTMRVIAMRAEATHKSVEDVARELLRLGLLMDVEGRVAVGDKIRAMTPNPPLDDSTEIIRRLRDGA